MKRKAVLSAVALILALSLCLCACGKKQDGPMTLTGWTLTPETWSSPNGATVHLSAEVNYKDTDVAAEFVVRIGDGDVVNEPCSWEKGKLTASAELNAADGYSYFLILTAADGTPTEVNLTPEDNALVNLKSALESYCNVVVEDSDYTGSTLTIAAGSVEIRVPQLTAGGKEITCKDVALVLLHDGEEITRTAVTPVSSEVPGGYEADIAGAAFTVPAMETDGQLLLRLDVTLSNGQSLSADGATWTYIDGQVVSTVG